jgi:hypothetical protein
MDFSSLPSGAGAGLVALSVLLVAAVIAATVLLRDHLRLEQHAIALEGEVQRLQDRTWRLAESEERYRGLIEAHLDLIVSATARAASPSPTSVSPISWARPRTG